MSRALRCTSIDPSHYKHFDHPSSHPFIIIPHQAIQPDLPFLDRGSGKRPTTEDTTEDWDAWTAGVDGASPANAAKRCKSTPSDTHPLRVGACVFVQGTSSTYKVQRYANGYWCDCPSMRFQGGDVSTRVCKHVTSLLNGTATLVTCDEGGGHGTTRGTAAPGGAIENRPRSRVAGSAHPRGDADQTSDRRAPPQKHDVALAATFDAAKHRNIFSPGGPTRKVMRKLDGVFFHWTGVAMFTRPDRGGGARSIDIPSSIASVLPPLAVTGEMHMGPRNFDASSGAVRRRDFSGLTFEVFDVVEDSWRAMLFTERMQKLRETHPPTGPYRIVELHSCAGMHDVDRLFAESQRDGEEGIIIRSDEPYRTGRSDAILKYKKHLSLDARVVAHKPGKNEAVGSLKCVLLSTGAEFFVVPQNRRHPPPIGSVVQFDCQELTSQGTPRFPVRARERAD